jgi:hypothetical protein
MKTYRIMNIKHQEEQDGGVLCCITMSLKLIFQFHRGLTSRDIQFSGSDNLCISNHSRTNCIAMTESSISTAFSKLCSPALEKLKDPVHTARA